MTTPRILSLHGFRSSSASWKTRALREVLRQRGQEDVLLTPDLPWEPAAAQQVCETLLETLRETPVTLLGSSLGGFYATYLAERYAKKAVLVNPAVLSCLPMTAWLGTHRHLHRDESFTLTPAHVEQFYAWEVSHLHPERYLLLLEKGDQVLDYRDALRHYAGCEQIVLEGGEHGFCQFVRFIPRILEFAGL
ncbi:MAG: alpha/beta fold hydrolase [Zoogloeaceae bacterium]|jgi:predicted esterase YcpF (UPF0227 family)|nr:alpha/beta fold hydrolase [Zoogloeaceae bacterium]